MTRRPSRALLALVAALACGRAAAWGAEGHHTVGALADRLIAGTSAQAHVRALLGGVTLEQAAVWADCAKGVDAAHGFAYTATGQYPECAVFETPAGIAAMVDFVRRNDANCPRAAGEPGCHRQWHYTDVAIQRRAYRLGDTGTRPFDIVGATSAALRVLRDEPVDGPFDLRDKREALLLLAHFAGDIAQPLHVGAVWLDDEGRPVDPLEARFEPRMGTRGGNAILLTGPLVHHAGENLHGAWDAIPGALRADRIDGAWLRRARAVPATRGRLAEWPARWADVTLDASRLALSGLHWGPRVGEHWSVALSPADEAAMRELKQRQLTAGGAWLAQALRAIWP